jgi:hypothetical protein
VGKHIGLLIGDEPPLAHALLARLGAAPGVHAEPVTLGGIAERTLARYDAIFDRMGHLVPHYRSYLRAAALAGTAVVNDPFVATDDAFYGLSVAARLGMAVPRTVLLPQKHYGAGVAPERMLGNLEFPLRWRDIAHHVGFPATLRAVSGPRFAPASLAHDGDLLAAFDRTGSFPTMVQARPAHLEASLLVVVVGGAAAAIVDLTPTCAPLALRREAGAISERLARALGAALCAVEVAVAARGLVVLDVQDAAPALDAHTLGEPALAAVLDRLAEHLAHLARSPTRGRSAWRTEPPP